MVEIKKAFLKFLKEEKNTFFKKFFYYFLFSLSFFYSFLVNLRNYLYDKKILKTYKSRKKLINIGNIVWGGTGKTSLVIYLAEKLKDKYKLACILKGYASDEYKLVREKIKNVFEAKNRVSLLKSLEDKFDVFLFDDCFQYRKLLYDLNILVMKEDDLGSPQLIPAGIWREPPQNIQRADLIIINYAKNKEYVKKKLAFLNKNLEIFFMHYRFKNFLNINKEIVEPSYFKNKNIGLLSAIGYPEGFLRSLKDEFDFLKIKKTIFYPDHFQFKQEELKKVEKEFLKEDIKDIIITHKDYYHINFEKASLNYFIFDVELQIEEEEAFLKKIEDVLSC